MPWVDRINVISADKDFRCLAMNLLAAILLVLASPAGASPLFESDDVLVFSLTGPLGSLIEEKKHETDRTFVFRANGVEQLINVRVRGKSRKRVCGFPLLRLEFGEGSSRQTPFAGQSKLKLVTHCTDRGSSEKNLLEEYASYKIFNLISEISYRVRLARITYTDSDRKLDQTTFDRYGILIEPASELAERVGGQPAKVEGVSIRSLDSRQAARVFIFQYLIANTDWSLVAAHDDDTCCHNGDLFHIGSQLYFVPNDFDLSGLVNAPYAKPDPSLRISRVTQRLYRGYCIPSESLAEALGDIRAQRENIISEIHQIPSFTQKDIDKTVKYLDRFFDQADDESKLLRSFERRCL